jgi:hypothetical protein
MKNNWISIDKELPPIQTRVNIKRSELIHDNMMENVIWESVGRYHYLKDKIIWSIKAVQGLSFSNSKPTHWKYIDE